MHGGAANVDQPGVAMKTSQDRILTTHVGSLPRSQEAVNMLGFPRFGGFARRVAERGHEDVAQPLLRWVQRVALVPVLGHVIAWE